MKKIVALVLVLALALSLATVAFAAVEFKDGKTYYSEYNTEFEFVAADEDDGKGNLDCFYDGTRYAVACAKTDKDAVAMYENEDFKVGDDCFYIKIVADTKVLYDMTGSAVAAAKFTCTTDEHKAGYKNANAAAGENPYYVAAKDTDVNVKTMLVDGKIVKVVADASYIEGTHLLYQYKSDAVSTGVYVYKCAICGKEFNAAMVKAYAGTNYATYNPNLTLINAIYNDDQDRADMRAYYGKVLKDLGLKASDFETDTLYLIGEGTTAASGVSSAKTFDAGVALYAGMALMSVAGSAVVIGKKKEF